MRTLLIGGAIAVARLRALGLRRFERELGFQQALERKADY